MNFAPYESKPVTRMAFQITPDVDIVQDSDAEWYVVTKDQCKTVWFKAHQEVKVGDWIVRLTDEDTYHCTDEVFRERNVVPE